MTSEVNFDVEFNEMLDEELGGLLELGSLEETRKGIRELRTLLQKRNLRRRLGLKDEMMQMPAEMRCAVFENFSDSDLIDTIIAFEEFESTAGYVLKRRKKEASLFVQKDGDNHDKELNMECDIRKANKVYDEGEFDYRIHKKLRFSSEMALSDYFCGFLRVVLLFMPITYEGDDENIGIYLADIGCSKLQPAKYFGPPATDVTDKATCRGLCVSNKVFAPLLQWILPTELIYNCNPKHLFDKRGELMIDGVRKVALRSHNYRHNNVDALMQKCKAENIELRERPFWSRNNFNAVLTEHANSGEEGKPREIVINDVPSEEHAAKYDEERTSRRFQGWSIESWTKRYDDWRLGHVAEHGEPRRDVTYESVTRDYDTTFKLHLH